LLAGEPVVTEPGEGSIDGDGSIDELVEPIRERLSEIQSRLAAAADGRQVTVVAVTKTFPLDITRLALRAGLVDVGENYGQDLVDKYDRLQAESATGGEGGPGIEPSQLRWHFIGGLQSNKIKALGSRVWLWQTVDRAKLIDGLASRVPGARILIQVNTTDEAQKSGCDPTEVSELVEHALRVGLDVCGLMTVGPTDGSDPRPGFALARDLAEHEGLGELSMGMSGDFELAAAEGATMVRLGSALFGPRSRPV
jgi:pyridoxal phosphate enzyme (YggS family)